MEDLAVGPVRDVGLLDSAAHRPGAVVFYGLHDVDLDAPDDPACELVMSVARGDPSIDEIAAGLSRWH